MKSKSEILQEQNDNRAKEFQGYVKLMNKTIKNLYPAGLVFNECPHFENFMCYTHAAVNYYTGLEEILVKAIKETESFKKMAKELIKNGYTFEFSTNTTIGFSGRTEWFIYLGVK